MALATDSSLEVVSLVLTKEQTKRLRAMRDVQSAGHRRISLSDVAREVVERGLESISHGSNIVLTASMSSDEENAA